MTQFKKQFQKFKFLLGILVFVLSIISLFNSFIGFILMGIAGVLIFPKTSSYIREKIKFNRILKNATALIFFLIGFFFFAEELTKEERELKNFLKSNNLTVCGVCKDLEGGQDKKAYQKSKAISDVYFEKILAKCKECKKEEQRVIAEREAKEKKIKEEKEANRMIVLKDSINQVLQAKGIEGICRLFDDLDEIFQRSIKIADEKYPNFGKEHNDYSFELEEKWTNEYLKKHKIKEDFFDTKIMLFVDECWEIQRQRRDKENELQKEKLSEAKEKRNKCKEAVCWKIGEVLKEGMNNPSSFEFVSCELINFNETYLKVRYTYRGTNGFGALVIDEKIVTAEYQNCSIVNTE